MVVLFGVLPIQGCSFITHLLGILMCTVIYEYFTIKQPSYHFNIAPLHAYLLQVCI
jgi:hypothetical protein